jgi:hypothetical protein
VISSGPAHQSPAVSRLRTVVSAVVCLTAAAGMARDRRTHEKVIVMALLVAAMAGLGRVGGVRLIERLIAWDSKHPWQNDDAKSKPRERG